MGRSVDTTDIENASKELVAGLSALTKGRDGEQEAEGIQFDMDSVTVLLGTLEARQLEYENIQWLLWHLMEHVIQGVGEVIDEAGDEELWPALDDWVEAVETKLNDRARKIACPRLDALLTSYWADAEAADDAEDKPPAGEEPERNAPEGE